MGASGRITGISLNGVRKLIEDRSLPEDILDIFGKLFGLAIVLSLLGGGTPQGFCGPCLGRRTRSSASARRPSRRLTRSRPSDYLDQAKRFAAANTLLTFTAFFDALLICEPELTAALGLTPRRQAPDRIAGCGTRGRSLASGRQLHLS